VGCLVRRRGAGWPRAKRVVLRADLFRLLRRDEASVQSLRSEPATDSSSSLGTVVTEGAPAIGGSWNLTARSLLETMSDTGRRGVKGEAGSENVRRAASEVSGSVGGSAASLGSAASVKVRGRRAERRRGRGLLGGGGCACACECEEEWEIREEYSWP
jgi:hypothetical protein